MSGENVETPEFICGITKATVVVEQCGVCYAEGVLYIGDMKDGIPHGQGKYYTLRGEEYVGNSVLGALDGLVFYRNIAGERGKLYYANGALRDIKLKTLLAYSGAGGLENASEIRFADGDFYIGEVDENGKMNGYGTLYGCAGRELKGCFLNGRLHGVGYIKFSSGDMIEGLFYHGVAQGFCVKTTKDEKLYGNFEKGLPTGWCMRTTTAKIVRLTRYENGVAVGDEYVVDKDGHVERIQSYIQ